MNNYVYYASPIGTIQIHEANNVIVGVDFIDHSDTNIHQTSSEQVSSVLAQCVIQLDEYFKGKRITFSVPIFQEGTPFQCSVWNALKSIPYGETRSYLDISTQIHNPKAVRAVGVTNSNNRLAIIVPCHRVIGKNGNMVGYASGIWRKEWLLAHEQTYKQ